MKKTKLLLSFQTRTSIFVQAILLIAAMARGSTESIPGNEAPRVFAVTTLIQETNKPWDKPIILEGFVAAVCPRSGKKAWLHDVDSQAAGTVRVERIGKAPIFEKDVIGKSVRVTGILRELRIDAAYLDSWESRVKGSNTVVEKQDSCTEKCEENQNVDAALKRIASMRAQVAKSKKGYLSNFWVDGTAWELIKAGATK